MNSLASCSSFGFPAITALLQPGYKAIGSTLSGGRIWSMAQFGTVIYMVGQFKTTYLTVSRCYVGTYDTATGAWGILGNGYFVGTGVDLREVCVDVNGVVYICGGNFTSILVDGGSTITTNNLARYNPSTSTWSGFGTGLNAYGRGVLVDSTATYLYVLGDFTAINGTSVTNMARITLSNSTISACNTNFFGSDGLRMYDNTVYALTNANGIMRYNTTTSAWETIGTGGTSAKCYGAGFDSAGNILAGGENWVQYYTYSTNTWATLGTSTGSMLECCIDPNGTLYSTALQTGLIRTWSGTAWTTVGIVDGYVKNIRNYNGRNYFSGSFSKITPTGKAAINANYIFTYY